MGTQVTIISNYLDEEKYRKSFNNLAYKTFGLDFKDWYERGYLKNAYIPYSIIMNLKKIYITFQKKILL